MLGMKYRYVTGYPGSVDVRMALQRGEIQMTSESLPSYRSAVEPSLIDKGQAIALWFDAPDEANNPQPHEAQGIKAKTYYDFYKSIKGQAPSGPQWEAFDTMNTLSRGFERILVLAPGSPKEAVSALKNALAGLRTDQDFKKDAIGMMNFVPDYDFSERIEKIYREESAPNQVMISFYEKYAEEGRILSMSK